MRNVFRQNEHKGWRIKSNSPSEPYLGGTMVTCNHCNGTGSCGFTKDWNLNKRSCHGTGKCPECIDGIVTDAFGSRVCSYCKGTAKCPICKGSGKCTKCHGTGKMKK